MSPQVPEFIGAILLQQLERRLCIYKMQLLNKQNKSLNRQVSRLQAQNQELRQDLAELQQRSIKVQEQRNRYLNQLRIARQTLDKIEHTTVLRIQNVRLQQRSLFEKSNAQSEIQPVQNKKLKEAISMLNRELQTKTSVISKLKITIHEAARKYNFQVPHYITQELTEASIDNQQRLTIISQKYQEVVKNYENLSAQNKVLRKLAGVPDNYGFDLQQIKKAQKQQSVDYKRRIKQLQAQVEDLQEQRAQLRFKLRSAGVIYAGQGNGQRYRGLTPQQLGILDEVALALKTGTYKNQKYHSIKQYEQQIKRLKKLVDQQSSIGDKETLESIRRGQDQLKSLLARGNRRGKQLSKVMQEEDDNIKSFVSLTQSRLKVQQGLAEVRSKIAIPTGSQAVSVSQKFQYNFGQALHPKLIQQLQNQLKSEDLSSLKEANLRLMKRSVYLEKSNQTILTAVQELKHQTLQIKQRFAKMVTKYDKTVLLLKQSQNRRKQQYNKNNVRNKETQLQLQESKAKAKSLEENLKTDQKSIKIKLAQSQGLVQRYLKERDFFQKLYEDSAKSLQSAQKSQVQQHYALKQKYFRTKALKDSLTSQTAFLLNQLKYSVSKSQYDKQVLLSNKAQNQLMNAQSKQIELRLKLSNIQENERLLEQRDMQIQLITQQNTDLQLQNSLLSKRLQQFDPIYERYSKFINKLASVLKSKNLSPLNFFAASVQERGQLNRDDLQAMFSSIGFKIVAEDIDIMLIFMDLNNSGFVDLNQFMRQMKRTGLTIRSNAEQALLKVAKAFRQYNYTIKDGFRAMDKNNSGQVSLDQLSAFLSDIGCPLKKVELEALFKLCLKDSTSRLRFQNFELLFGKVMSSVQVQDQLIFKTSLDWKDSLVLRIYDYVKAQGKSVSQVYNEVDIDGNKKVNLIEFTRMMNNVSSKLTQSQIQDLFNYVDGTRSGFLDYSKFIKMFKDSLRSKSLIEKHAFIAKRSKQIKQNLQLDPQINNSKLNSIKAETRVGILQLKLKSSNQKIQSLARNLAKKQEQLSELNRFHQKQQVQLTKVREQLFVQKERGKQIQDQLKGRMPVKESELLKKQNKKLQLQYIQSKNALQLYMNYSVNFADMSNSYKRIAEEAKEQCIRVNGLLKEAAVEEGRAQLIQLQRSLNKSKHQHLQLTQKHQRFISQHIYLKHQNIKFEADLESKEKQLYELTKAFIQLKHDANHKIMQSGAGEGVSPERLEMLSEKVREISQQKMQLQETLQLQKQKGFQLQLKMDILQNQRDKILYLQNTLKSKNRGQLQRQLIDLSERMSQLRLSQLKSKRQLVLFKEKSQHSDRIVNANKNHIQNLQTQLAQFQTKLLKRQEFWRKKLSSVRAQRAIQKQLPIVIKPNQLKESMASNKQWVLKESLEETRRNMAISKGEISRLKQTKLEVLSIQPQKVIKVPGQLQERTSQMSKLRSNKKQPTKVQNEIKIPSSPMAQLRESADRQQINKLSVLLKERQAELNNYKIQQNNYQQVGIKLKTSLNQNQYLQAQERKLKQLNQENRRVTLAAQESISTLQRMIDDKNSQLQRKQRQLIQFKSQILKERQIFQNQRCIFQTQIKNLNQISSKSNRLRQLDLGQGSFKPQPVGKIKQLQSLALIQSDLKKTIGNNSKAKGQLDILRKQNDELRKQTTKLKKELQNKSQQANQVQTLRRLLAAKQKDIRTLNDSLQQIKKKLFKEIQEKPEETVKQQKSPERGISTDAGLEMELQNAARTIQRLSKQNKQKEQQLRRLRETVQKIKR